MSVISYGLVALVALLHAYILWLEMFQWTTRGPKVFKTLHPDLFEPTKAMAANQGLYNGFLTAGLVWSMFISDPDWQRNVALCFLLFVLVAGIYGALSVSRRIFFVQGVPAALAIASLFLF